MPDGRCHAVQDKTSAWTAHLSSLPVGSLLGGQQLLVLALSLVSTLLGLESCLLCLEPGCFLDIAVMA